MKRVRMEGGVRGGEGRRGKGESEGRRDGGRVQRRGVDGWMDGGRKGG